MLLDLEAVQGPHVTGYRCYLMSGETSQAVQNFECADDAEVILKANALLDSNPEIWEGKRLVARVTRNPAAETFQQDNVVRVVKRKDD